MFDLLARLSRRAVPVTISAFQPHVDSKIYTLLHVTLSLFTKPCLILRCLFCMGDRGYPGTFVLIDPPRSILIDGRILSPIVWG